MVVLPQTIGTKQGKYKKTVRRGEREKE